jgi:hypothetical protein
LSKIEVVKLFFLKTKFIFLDQRKGNVFQEDRRFLISIRYVLKLQIKMHSFLQHQTTCKKLGDAVCQPSWLQFRSAELIKPKCVSASFRIIVKFEDVRLLRLRIDLFSHVHGRKQNSSFYVGGREGTNNTVVEGLSKTNWEDEAGCHLFHRSCDLIFLLKTSMISFLSVRSFASSRQLNQVSTATFLLVPRIHSLNCRMYCFGNV